MTSDTSVASLPGPRGIPLLGRAGSMIRFFKDPIPLLRHLHATYGSVAAVTGGSAGLVCAFGPELNRQVLSDPDLYQNAVELPIRNPPGTALRRLTNFLVGMNGEEHRRLRRVMAPIFQKKFLDHHRDDVVTATESALADWKPGQELDLTEATAEVALCISFRCLFDLDVRSEAKTLADMALEFTTGATSLKLILFPLSLPGLPYWNFVKLCERLEGRLMALIEERRGETKERHDVLSIMMRAEDEQGGRLPDPILLGLANELFIAGHETTARTLAWTLFLLERHPKVMSDLLDELTPVLGGGAPTIDQLAQLPLLEAVIKESMRLLSPTPFVFFRRNTGTVKVGPYELPTGSSLVISPIVTHHMPELYPEPNRFKPERWSTAKPGPYEYLPFSAGPRTCIGASFAMMAMRVALAMIVQRYRVELPAGAELSYRARGTILGSKEPIRVRVQKQDRGPGPLHALRGTVHELVDLPS